MLSKLKLKKGLVFKHKYFLICDDNIYLTDDFALECVDNKNLIKQNYISYILAKFNIQLFDYKKREKDCITIFFKKYSFIETEYKKYKWLICGESPLSYQYNINDTFYAVKPLSLKKKRLIIKAVIEVFLDIKKFNREEKLQELFK